MGENVTSLLSDAELLILARQLSDKLGNLAEWVVSDASKHLAHSPAAPISAPVCSDYVRRDVVKRWRVPRFCAGFQTPHLLIVGARLYIDEVGLQFGTHAHVQPKTWCLAEGFGLIDHQLMRDSASMLYKLARRRKFEDINRLLRLFAPHTRILAIAIRHGDDVFSDFYNVLGEIVASWVKDCKQLADEVYYGVADEWRKLDLELDPANNMTIVEYEAAAADQDAWMRMRLWRLA